MLIEYTRLDEVYDTIVAAGRSEGGAVTVALLVAQDCDAICALTILKEMLRRDQVAYEVFPVRDYTHFGEQGAVLRGLQTLRLAVLVNCGALSVLEESLGLSDSVVVFVFDSHRPVNLVNLYDMPSVYLVDDGVRRGEHIPSRETFELASEYTRMMASGEDMDDEALDDERAAELLGSSSSSSGSDSEGSGAAAGDSDADADAGAGAGAGAGGARAGKPSRAGRSGGEDDDDGGGTDSDSDGSASDDAGPGGGSDGEAASAGRSKAGAEKRRRRARPEGGDPAGDDDDGSDRNDGSGDDNEDEDEAESAEEGGSDDEESGSDGDRPRAGRRLKKRVQVDTGKRRAVDDDDDAGVASGDDAAAGSGSDADEAGRPVDPMARAQRLARLRQRRKRAMAEVNAYMERTYFSMPAALLVYHMAAQKNRETIEFLWYAIVGVTDHLLFDRMSMDDYTQMLESVQQEVRLKSTGRGDAIDVDGVNVALPAPMSIAPVDELRLMLYRHWTLYESLTYSSYVATRVGVWRERGMSRLKDFISKMGIRLDQLQQNYAVTAKQTRELFAEAFVRLAPEYDLPDATFPSFVLRRSCEEPLAASDVVYAVTALLEHATRFRRDDGDHVLYAANRAPSAAELMMQPSARMFTTTAAARASTPNRGSGQSSAASSSVNSPDVQTVPTGRRIPHDWMSNFNAACEALVGREQLQAGIDLAIWLQKAVVRRGSSIIVKRQMQRLYWFQLCMVEGGADVAVFTNPLCMKRLSEFLLSAIQLQYKKRGAAQRSALDDASTLLLAVRDTGDDAYVVSGMVREQSGSSRNYFGKAFMNAAVSASMEMRMRAFDMTVVEVAKDDLEGFLENVYANLVAAGTR